MLRANIVLHVLPMLGFYWKDKGTEMPNNLLRPGTSLGR